MYEGYDRDYFVRQDDFKEKVGYSIVYERLKSISYFSYYEKFPQCQARMDVNNKKCWTSSA